MLQVLFTSTFLVCILGIGGIIARAQTQPEAAEIYEILEQGQQYRLSLELERDRLYQSIKSLNTENAAALYRLADVKLNDFAAFETLVFGMFDIYDRTVNQHVRGDGAAYDFRTPALKLTFEFQLAIKEAHEHLQMHSFDELRKITQLSPQKALDPRPPADDAKPTSTYTPHHVHTEGDAPDSREAVKEMLHGMLEEIRENADQLERGMQQHNLAFPSNGHGATIETVLKLSEDIENGSQDTGEEGAVLIDQDNNQYIMTRPSDTTVIYEDMQLLHDFILIIVISFMFGWIFSLIGLPSFFGYILAGIVMGPSGCNLIKELIQTETLAQLGVVFIVFVLGLEFSMERLRAMWRLALGGAIMILVVTVILFVFMGAIVGATMKEAIFVGACVSLSSTAVVVKCIRLDHLDHLYGLLVMQDVLLGFMLAIMPALSKSGVQVMIAILKISLSFTIFGALCFGIVRTIPSLPRLSKRIFPNKAVQYSHELMLLGTMAVCLIMLLLSDYLGLGMEIGCFAAGVIVRSRKNMFEASLAVIEPVRDLFACLFFASIGLHIYPSFLVSEALLLITLAAAVIGFKYTTTLGVLTFFKLDLGKSSIMAIALAQISEFAFVLASRAKHLRIISREVYYLLLAVTSLTLMATPLLWKLFDRSSLPLTSSSSSSSSHNPQHHNHNHYPHHFHHHHHPPPSHEDYSIVSVSMDDTDKVA